MIKTNETQQKISELDGLVVKIIHDLQSQYMKYSQHSYNTFSILDITYKYSKKHVLLRSLLYSIKINNRIPIRLISIYKRLSQFDAR